MRPCAVLAAVTECPSCPKQRTATCENGRVVDLRGGQGRDLIERPLLRREVGGLPAAWCAASDNQPLSYREVVASDISIVSLAKELRLIVVGQGPTTYLWWAGGLLVPRRQSRWRGRALTFCWLSVSAYSATESGVR